MIERYIPIFSSSYLSAFYKFIKHEVTVNIQDSSISLMKNAYFKLTFILYKKLGFLASSGFLTNKRKRKADIPKTIIITISTLFTKN